MRLDKYLQETQSISRNKAQMLIADASVLLNGEVITKTSYTVKSTDTIDIKQNQKINYVSRSALKLKSFLLNQNILFPSKAILLPVKIKGSGKGFSCLDIGASTGGFTQVLLEFGADSVTAVDVGSSQLETSLQNNPRVKSRENTDIRTYDTNETFDIITCDVSFISLTKILEKIIELAGKNTKIVLLYKPQFEVGKKNLTKQNLPKTEKIIQAYLNNFLSLARESHLKVLDVQKSGLTGEAGTQEYIISLRKAS